MKDRIIELLKQENLSATKFADIIRVQRSSISHILSGRNKPSYDFIEKTLLNFPDINAEWLILGKGSIYKQQTELNSNIADSKIEVNNDLFSKSLENKSNTSVDKNSGTSENTQINKENPQVTNVNLSRVEKIVIFYDDKTYKAYDPQ